ncbi:Na+/H+ antiporter NhaC family protein [Vibrio sp. S11_S32]|uniref:Na+/H+ antiporter NhaC family protein n=1 Tax=Vibrio sp. S11_S32 TaxID=2720225 RepID=UPI001680D1F5|nr:Na+/H+ antiporter NhaC family protein [Vibrio sp. S11_S32]MBD1575428.1 Na+/H+ antiporter NhaC family protein [Vibrio sp. S11_S32]
MNLIDFTSSPESLLPPLVALTMAILTRRVLLSLGLGILLGGFLLADYSLVHTFSYVSSKALGVFVDGASLNWNNIFILVFLILLGMTTALLTLSGGTYAFAEWAQKRIKTKRGAKLLAVWLGVFIFIDDYFNSLAVGAIARPVTDRYYVSRSKLAYILDSTAAPMCVIMPASSWGAYIMTVVSGILVSHGITEYSALGAYMRLIPMNFYAIFALLMVFAVVWFDLNVGPMRQHELAAKQGKTDDKDDNAVDLTEESEIEESKNGRVSNLILPIVALIVATVYFMIASGANVLEDDGQAFSLLKAFENTNVGQSLCFGALVGIVVALITVARQKMPIKDVVITLWIGAKSMFGAILILAFAWTIGAVIKDMGTGAYLSTLVEGSIDDHWLPVILFLLSGVMAFSTGTSWGTFGIMLPIAGDMAGATDLALMLPMLSAVLAGSVFGDHCSPISDTTILSSTGARCNHIDHVSTQLPYALATAFISAVGFLVLGLTVNVWLGLLASSITFVLVCFALSIIAKSKMPTKA